MPFRGIFWTLCPKSKHPGLCRQGQPSAKLSRRTYRPPQGVSTVPSYYAARHTRTPPTCIPCSSREIWAHFASSHAERLSNCRKKLPRSRTGPCTCVAFHLQKAGRRFLRNKEPTQLPLALKTSIGRKTVPLATTRAPCPPSIVPMNPGANLLPTHLQKTMQVRLDTALAHCAERSCAPLLVFGEAPRPA